MCSFGASAPLRRFDGARRARHCVGVLAAPRLMDGSLGDILVGLGDIRVLVGSMRRARPRATPADPHGNDLWGERRAGIQVLWRRRSGGRGFYCHSARHRVLSRSEEASSRVDLPLCACHPACTQQCRHALPRNGARCGREARAGESSTAASLALWAAGWGPT